jgi:hypothetical protein
MGKPLFDKFTYLHFGSGIVSYYWGISLIWFLVLHTIFETVENTKTGVHIIDQYLTFWPGGKKSPDTFINIFGDTIGALAGWLSAYGMENYVFGEAK